MSRIRPLRALSLFARIVWRPWYGGRLTIREAWAVAKIWL